MPQNLGDVVVIDDYYSQDGFVYAGNWGEFTDYHLVANQQMTLLNGVLLDSTPGSIFPTNAIFEAPKIIINTVVSGNYYGIAIWNNGSNILTFNNSSVNFDNAEYDYTETDYIGPIAFTGNSSINITSNTNGKTIIYASTLTGTVSLDVESDVQDGDTFLIQATDNQLVIIDGEWSATPSTSGNVTIYTLAKAGPSKKQRLFYTYDNGEKVLRFLRSGLQ